MATVNIHDPVAGFSWTLYPQTHFAQKAPISSGMGLAMPTAGVSLPPEPRPKKQEDLGKQMIG